jgi:hypothetical protein
MDLLTAVAGDNRGQVGRKKAGLRDEGDPA